MAFLSVIPSTAIASGAKEMRGVKIVLDPGHGGQDPGAVGPSGLTEKAMVLSIAKYIRKNLESHGAKVTMTRNSDVFIPLEERANIANRARANRFISIHLNASTNRSKNVTETYYQKPQSRKMAMYVQSRMFRKLKRPNGSIKTADFAVIRRTNMPGILTEGSFISNPTEEGRLKRSSYRKKMAESIFEGIGRMYGVRSKNVAKRVPVPKQKVEAKAKIPANKDGFIERQLKNVFAVFLPKAGNEVVNVKKAEVKKETKIDVDTVSLVPFASTIVERDGVTQMKTLFVTTPSSKPFRIKNVSNRKVQPKINIFNIAGQKIAEINPVLKKKKVFYFEPTNINGTQEFAGSVEISAPETEINTPNTVATITE